MKDLVFFGWCIFIMFTLSFKGMTWDSPHKSKPNQSYGEPITKKGGFLDSPTDSVTHNKRYFRSYCPLVEKKPKQWGKYLR